MCHLQTRHDVLFAELDAMTKAVTAKADEIKEVQASLDAFMQKEAQQRQGLVERTQLQLSAWLDKINTQE